MKTLTDILLEVQTENAKYFQNPVFFTRKIKKEVKNSLKDAKVYLFGSVVEGRTSPGSDIDVLISSKIMPERQEDRAKIKAKIWKKIELYSPFEIHMVDSEQLLWYKKFAKLIEV